MVAATGRLRGQRVRLSGVWLDSRLKNAPNFSVAAKRGARGASLWGSEAARDAEFEQYVKNAAGAFAPLYDETSGGCGYVSVPLPPCLACAADKIDGEAADLYRSVGAPNVMAEVGISGESVEALRTLSAAGIPVMGSAMTRAHAKSVVEAYLKGLEARSDKDMDAGAAALGVKVYVAALDAWMNPLLESRMASAPIESIRAAYRVLIGRVGVSTAKMIYRDLQITLNSARWQMLKDRGAREPFLVFSLFTPADRKAPPPGAQELYGPGAFPGVRSRLVSKLSKDAATATITEDADDARFKLDKLANYQIDLDRVADEILEEERRYDEMAREDEDLE
jgi:transaldolase/glucose-6-phosphate isomerase